ncbi:MAG: TolC family protein [Prolixibacteraceae bacterium]
MKRRCVIFIYLSLIFPPALVAQESEISKLVPEDYASLQLPPLVTLFENAKKSAAVEFFSIKKEEQESLLRTEKRSWMKYFKANANYQYGKTGVLSYSEDNLSLYQYSDIQQSFYSVGGSISIPMDDLFDRPNRVKRQKLEMQATEVEVEKWHDEQKLRIIEAYTDAEQYLSVLKIKIEALILANAQYRIAENNFINGTMTSQELNNQKSFQVSAYADYEQTRSSLNKALLQLEVLSKTKILNTPN